MTDTIAYDKPIADFIPGMNETGHVTHTTAQKTSVTIHHNAGFNTFQDILNGWRTQQSSAHFDVDKDGNVAQYVKVDEYAWAVGNHDGNVTSISIEHCNSSLGPNWDVSPTTWQAGARLAAWLFANVIHAAPTSENLLPHHHWSATACPGPFMDSIWSEILAYTQARYNEFVNGAAPAPPSQGLLPLSVVARQVIEGLWGNDPARSQRLTADGYDAAAVQAQVNEMLNHASKPALLPIETVAQQVIRGLWGNGTERTSRLTAAGYNAAAVQAQVNADLKK